MVLPVRLEAIHAKRVLHAVVILNRHEVVESNTFLRHELLCLLDDKEDHKTETKRSTISIHTELVFTSAIHPGFGHSRLKYNFYVRHEPFLIYMLLSEYKPVCLHLSSILPL